MTSTERHIELEGNRTISGFVRGCDEFPIIVSDNPAREQIGPGAPQYLEMPQILLNEISNGFGNQRLQLFGCCDQSTPKIFRPLTTSPHSQKCVIMVNDRFRDNEGMCGVGKKIAHYALQSS